MDLRLCKIIVDHAHDRYADGYSEEKKEYLIIATSIDEIVQKVITKTEQYSWTTEFRLNPVLNNKDIKEVFIENNLCQNLAEKGCFECLVPVYEQRDLDEFFNEDNFRLRDKLLIEVQIMDSTKIS